jgi:hypothetical protein
MVCGECGDKCDCTKPHAKPKKFVWTDWTPGCAKIFSKKVLLQKKITKTVPSYKWVVEELCPTCEANCDCAEAPAGADVPPPPVADARLLFRQASQ